MNIPHQIGGKYILGDPAIELQGIAGGIDNVFRKLRWIGAPVRNEEVGIQ